MKTENNFVKILYAIILLILLLFFGTIGFLLIEGFSLLDSIYMTVITISTVGFGEVYKLSVSGKIFTIILILSSFIALAYVVSTLTTQFFEGQIHFILRGYQNKSRFKKMKNHIIICGYGRNGQQVASDLQMANQKYIVIDSNNNIFPQNQNKNLLFIEGDATNDEILKQAKVEKASALITTLPNDADNLFVALSARSLNPNIKIISRASNISSEQKLKTAGVNNIVMPEKVAGSHMATLVIKPDIIDFIEHLSIQGKSLINLEEIICDKLPKDALNKSIDEIGVRSKTGVNIIGFKTPDGKFVINPSPNTKVIPHSKIFVIGTKEQITLTRNIFHQAT